MTSFTFIPTDETFDDNVRELRRITLSRYAPQPKFINIIVDGKAVSTKSVRIHPTGLLEFNGWRYERERIQKIIVAF